MDLRYGMRRLLYAFILAAFLHVLWTALYCPVSVPVYPRESGSSGCVPPPVSPVGERAVFMPAWTVAGKTLHGGWLLLQGGLSLLAGVGCWLAYPRLHPPPPSEE